MDENFVYDNICEEELNKIESVHHTLVNNYTQKNSILIYDEICKKPIYKNCYDILRKFQSQGYLTHKKSAILAYVIIQEWQKENAELNLLDDQEKNIAARAYANMLIKIIDQLGQEFDNKMEATNFESNSNSKGNALVVIDNENLSGMILENDKNKSPDIISLLKYIEDQNYNIISTIVYQYNKDYSGKFENFLTFNNILFKTAKDTEYDNADELIINDLNNLLQGKLVDKDGLILKDRIDTVVLVSGDSDFLEALLALRKKQINIALFSTYKSFSKKVYHTQEDFAVYFLDDVLEDLSFESRRTRESKKLLEQEKQNNDSEQLKNQAKETGLIKFNTTLEIFAKSDFIHSLIDLMDRIPERFSFIEININ